MRLQTTRSNRSVLLRFIKATFMAGLLPALVLLFSVQSSLAGSATWNQNPTSGDWNTAANWTPATVPNGPSDTATFGTSDVTNLSLSEPTEVNSIVFNPGASAFAITASDNGHLIISGVGIVNNSGITQRFVTAVDAFYNLQVVEFDGGASAGVSTSFTNTGSIGMGISGGWTYFKNRSTAGQASFTNEGGTFPGTNGGAAYFFNSTTADHAVIVNNPGTARGAYGGKVTFSDRGSAEAAIITNVGGCGGLDCGTGGYTEFYPGTTASQATLIAQGGVNTYLEGGTVYFYSDSDGGTARIELFDLGTLDLSHNFSGAVNIGSIEGDGVVVLGYGIAASIGVNSRSTIFTGEIRNGLNESGSLIKVGQGTLTLNGSNTYQDGTVVQEGGLVVDTLVGSGTGTGAVQVNGGRLGGRGTITGDVTIGSGSGAGAVLIPSAATNRPATLHIYGSVTFKSDSTYASKLHPNRGKADSLLTNGGVTIESGAVFSFVGNGSATITPGTVFTVIRNNAATPIVGTFSNLPDGSTITVGSNTFQANYEGGDGNDLTLTVVL